MRNKISDEAIFLEHITTLIKNLLIDNENYNNGYYFGKSAFDVIKDTQERAKLILEQVESTKHLIEPNKIPDSCVNCPVYEVCSVCIHDSDSCNKVWKKLV